MKIELLSAIAFILIALVLIVACAPKMTPQEREESSHRESSVSSIVSETMIISTSLWEDIGKSTSVKRVEFKDAICYVSKGYNSGGIGCIRKVAPNEK